MSWPMREMYTINDLELTAYINGALEEYIAEMTKENILTQTQSDQLHSFRIIVKPKGLFGKLFERLKDKHEVEERSMYKVVKVL